MTAPKNDPLFPPIPKKKIPLTSTEMFMDFNKWLTKVGEEQLRVFARDAFWKSGFKKTATDGCTPDIRQAFIAEAYYGLAIRPHDGVLGRVDVHG